METNQQQQEERHMNNEPTTALFNFMKAQTSTGKQVSPSRRAQPPETWSMRVDLPLVRESMRDVNGAPVRARTPEDVAALCADLRQSAQEAFIVIDLNAKNNVMDKRLITLGLLDASLVHPREVFRGAVLNNAAALVAVHNHPSGDPTPSAEDIRITRQLVEAGKILGIKLLDHVIIGRPDAAGNGTPGHLSIREAGLVSFTD
jgi:DNA repair protein RadC